MDKRLDLLNRESFVGDVFKVVNQLSEIEKGCCFAIEGGWGVGKTFVIEEIEEKLRVAQSESTGMDRYFVFHYNCWQYDYYEEPAVAIISAMLTSVKKDAVLVNENIEAYIKAGYEFVIERFKDIAGLYIENKIGINIISLTDEIKGIKDNDESAEYEFDKMFNFSQTIEKVRKKLQEIAEQRTIVLFVDELDRCIPQYAIKVLERLHHIFYGLDNVVVIMAIDRKQLEHSVEEMFGTRKDDLSIDVEKYLKKFIDFSMVLDNGIVNESYWEKYKIYFDRFEIKQDGDEEEITNIIPILFSWTDIRRQEKIIEKANMVHSLICNVKVDISVLVFEIMYEVLRSWGFRNFQYIATICDINYTILEKQVERSKVDVLKSFADKAYDNIRAVYALQNIVTIARNNIYGKVFWYFANIFYDEKVPYADIRDIKQQITNELEVAKKYCEFCEIVK